MTALRVRSFRSWTLLTPVIVVVAVVASTACSSSSRNAVGDDDEKNHHRSDARTGQTSSAIINGTLDTTHPAVVAIIISKGTQGGLCTGTIVKTDAQRHVAWVVTAAHCVKSPPTLVVQAEDILSPSSLRYDIIDYKADSRWSGATASAYDFAVVRIAGADATTAVLPLIPTASDGLVNGSAVKSVGFGRTTLIGAGTTPDTNTHRYFVNKTLNSLNSSHMGFDQASSGICQGDSGGPVLLGQPGSEKVVGVHSYVSSDCDAEGVSGRVTLALDSFFTPELTKALPPEDCSLCGLIANSGKSECAALTASCFSNPTCKGYYECLSDKPKADCLKQYPLAEGPFNAAANCICTRACTTVCKTDQACSTVPKCGFANERGDCATCIEGSCCTEELDCASDGQCYVCLKTNDADPACANNPIRKKLATCASGKCQKQCAGAVIQNNAEPTPPAEEEEAPPPTDTGAPGAQTITRTEGCTVSSYASAFDTRAWFSAAVGAIAFGALRRRRRRRH